MFDWWLPGGEFQKMDTENASLNVSKQSVDQVYSDLPPNSDPVY